VTNLLRVLSLPEEVQQMVEKGLLSTGHARALLALGPEQSDAGAWRTRRSQADSVFVS